MSRRRTRLWSGFANQMMLCVLVFFTLMGASHQQDAARSWDNFSRLIPTNSVYERRDPSGNRADVSLIRSLDENNVMDSSKAETEGELDEEHEGEHDEEHEGEREVEYEDDYDVETEPRDDFEHVDKNTKSGKITDEAVSGESEASNNSSSEVDDPPMNQYDAYYYYDDYDNSSRSRYEAIEDDVDYPEGEEIAAEEEVIHDRPEDSKKVSKDDKVETQSLSPETANSTTPKSSVLTYEDEDDEEDPIVLRTNQDQEQTSMEGSDKSFSIIGPPSDDNFDSSILIGEAVVSVVTTKSVVNGTISVPSTTSTPLTTQQVAAPPASSTSGEIHQPPPSVTTEDSSIILASVQTSRSISGARFLPFPVIDRVEQIDHDGMEARKTSAPPESTESIIDKLDRVQSELSSGILAGGFRTAGNTLQLDVLAQGGRRRFTTTARTPVISKFVPKRYNDRRLEQSTTPRARIETTLDNLEGLLPRDYDGRPKTGFRWPTKITTSTTGAPEPKTTTESTGTTKKTKLLSAPVQDISAFLPPGYNLKKEDAAVTESSLLSDILAKSKVDISSLLPAGYDKKKTDQSAPATATVSTKSAPTTTEKHAEKSIQDLFAKSKFDISSLLPRDYDVKNRNVSVAGVEQSMINETSTTTTTAATTKKSGSIKLVFPSRPGGRKPIHKITTPHTPRGEGSGPVTPRIQKGWPTRATTEFTGWPTPSTTPISIEKLLEAARTATVASINASHAPITEAVSTTSTTSTTTTTLRPTTPGVCDDECEVAGTIRLIGNATWVPELLDRNTHEWQQLADEVEREMNFVFSKSAVLTNWFKKIRIDSFSQGSILVDYFVELAKLQQRVNTQELKVIFHDSLRTYNANRWNETKTKGPMRLGAFTIDPKFTDFVVIPKIATPQQVEKDDRLIPQWAIAVIVIGVGGLLFIIVFGVSVLVNRQNGSKLKPTMSTIYDEDVGKNIISGNASSTQRSTDYSKPVHTIWTDPDVSWNDKSFESTSNKMLVDRSYQDNKKYNLYDSWRSEWNGYYYNPSHTSSKYAGYDSTTNLSSRHHPDYDTNF